MGEEEELFGEEEQEFEENDDDSAKDPDFTVDKDDVGALDDEELDMEHATLDDMVEEDGSIRFDDLNFVKIIESVGKCLLQKSQTPAMKKKKQQALTKVISECSSKFDVTLTDKQAKRKLDNLKARVKQKIDRKKTGNLPIILNEADQLLLNLLDAEENPSIVQVPCKYSLFSKIL